MTKSVLPVVNCNWLLGGTINFKLYSSVCSAQMNRDRGYKHNAHNCALEMINICSWCIFLVKVSLPDMRKTLNYPVESTSVVESSSNSILEVIYMIFGDLRASYCPLCNRSWYVQVIYLVDRRCLVLQTLVSCARLTYTHNPDVSRTYSQQEGTRRLLFPSSTLKATLMQRYEIIVGGALQALANR